MNAKGPGLPVDAGACGIGSNRGVVRTRPHTRLQGGGAIWALGFAAVMLCAVLQTVSAQDLSPEIIADQCATCHGPDGRSPGTIPSLHGLEAETIAGKLLAFKAGELEATIMGRIASAYSDAEIEQLALYLAAAQN